jgi:hypothetical protein
MSTHVMVGTRRSAAVSAGWPRIAHRQQLFSQDRLRFYL